MKLSVFLLLGLWGLVGCVTTEDMDRIHREINNMHTDLLKLQNLTSKREDLQLAVQDVKADIDQLMRSNADTRMQLEDVLKNIEALQTQLIDTNRRLAQLSQELAFTQKRLGALSPSPESSVPVTPGEKPAQTSTSEDLLKPGDLYNQSYQDYLKGNYALAISGFQEYIKQYPQTQSTDDAYFYIGESLYAQKKYDEALKYYEKLLTLFPSSEFAPAARLKKGYCFFELGDKAQGIVEMQYVIYEYPNSEEANQAKQKLQSLEIPIQ